MSDFKVECFVVGKCAKNENSDRLMVTDALGYPVQFCVGDFVEGDLVAYVPVESLVPLDRPQFSFLKNPKRPSRTHERIKAKKLRSVFSMGMLVKPPEGAKAGDDIAPLLGITKYEEPEEDVVFAKTPAEPLVGWPLPRAKTVWWFRKLFGIKGNKPKSVLPVYDLEPLRRHQKALALGEPVVLTEKIHGCVNAMTQIWMADGSRKPVAEVVIGDEVVGVSEDGLVVATPVTNVFRNGHTNEWLKIVCSRKSAGRGSSFASVTVTPDH